MPNRRAIDGTILHGMSRMGSCNPQKMRLVGVTEAIYQIPAPARPHRGRDSRSEMRGHTQPRRENARRAALTEAGSQSAPDQPPTKNPEEPKSEASGRSCYNTRRPSR